MNETTLQPATQAPGQWDGYRLGLSFGSCALFVFAAILFERCG